MLLKFIENPQKNEIDKDTDRCFVKEIYIFTEKKTIGHTDKWKREETNKKNHHGRIEKKRKKHAEQRQIEKARPIIKKHGRE